MGRYFYGSILSLATTTAVLVPGVALAGTEVIDDKIIWRGNPEEEYEGIIREYSGSNGYNKMEVHDYNIVNFQNSRDFNKLSIEAAISLGGGNGAITGEPGKQTYGNLELTVYNSSVTGAISPSPSKGSQWMGMYSRTDSEEATVAIKSNSVIDLTINNGANYVHGAGIYAENYGEKGNSNVTLLDGSSITVSMQGTGHGDGMNSGAFAYANQGAASVIAEQGSTITTTGSGTDGIKTVSRDSALIINAGEINNTGEKGRGIHSHGDHGEGKVEIANLDTAAINIDGNDSYGIFSFSFGTGGVSVYNGGNITLSDASDNSTAIYLDNFVDEKYTAEDVVLSVVNAGKIVAGGSNSTGISATGWLDSGSLAVSNTGTMTLSGVSSLGIKATAQQHNANSDDATAMFIHNGGSIILGNDAGKSTAIIAQNNTAQGSIHIVNEGMLSLAGSQSDAIQAEGRQDISVLNQGTISTVDGSGITAQAESGETRVLNTGSINIGSSTSFLNYGIHAINNTGLAAVKYAKGVLTATGNSIGIGTSGSGMQKIEIDSGSYIDASKGVGGVQISGSSEGYISISNGAAVIGGSNNGFGAKYTGSTNGNAPTSQFTLNNAGSLGALSDVAFVAENATGSQLTLNNYGDITGYLLADGGNIRLTNYNTLNLRSFTDSDGDYIRDTRQVAIMKFGMGDNVVNNEAGAIIQLSSVSGESLVDTSGEFSTQGTRSITTQGINQGQMLGVSQFNHAGVLNLAANQLAGDILAITNNSSLAGYSVHDGGNIQSGGGRFISDSGTLILDTVMNEGGKASQSDVLVVDNASKGNGATTIIINQIGGKGTITQGDGIQVVNVLGYASNDAFALAGGSVRSGAYEYTLEQGSYSNPANQSFYLRTNSQQINPDLGSYLANQTMATGLFMHSLHDRLGEPQYTQRYKGDERAVPGMWLRGVASNSKMDAAGRTLSQDMNSRVLHMGGDLTRWDNDNGDRYHLGVMGAYGRADTVSKSKKTGSSSRSKVDGYGVGTYLTWYNKAGQQEGWYADLWGMYNWFDNTADSAKDYHSKSWVMSLESGHASTIIPFEKWCWMVEPQGQISYSHYNSDSITDRSGTEIGNQDANGLSTRLGVRSYLQPTAPNDKAKFQPYLTVNWLWSSANNSIDFNGATFSSDLPKNRFEAKLGLQAEVHKDFHIYGQISGQVGENNYSHKSGQLGLRYNF